MPVRIRGPRLPDETDEQFQARDDAHWEAVAKDEARVLKLRELWTPKKQDKGYKV